MSVILQAVIRDQIGTALQTARKAGKIPAVVYGTGKPSRSLFINESDFIKLYRQVGKTKMFDLDINGEKKGVLVSDVQRDPVRDIPIHIDFIEIDQTKEMHISVPIHLINEAPAIKNKGGIIRAANVLEVEVACLPKDLIANVEADLSVLEDFNQHILASDLKFPKGVRLLTDPHMVIVTIRHPRKQEDLSTPVAESVLPEATAQKAPEEGAVAGEGDAKDEKKEAKGEKKEDKK